MSESLLYTVLYHILYVPRIFLRKPNAQPGNHDGRAAEKTRHGTSVLYYIRDLKIYEVSFNDGVL